MEGETMRQGEKMTRFYCAGCGNLHSFPEKIAERLVYALADLLTDGGGGLPLKVVGNKLQTVVCLQAILDREYDQVQADMKRTISEYAATLGNVDMADVNMQDVVL